MLGIVFGGLTFAEYGLTILISAAETELGAEVPYAPMQEWLTVYRMGGRRRRLCRPGRCSRRGMEMSCVASRMEASGI